MKSSSSKTESFSRYQAQSASIKKKIHFGYSLFLSKAFTKFKHLNTWDKVDEHLYLGEIPTITLANTLVKEIPNLRLVVSVVEPDEFHKNRLFRLTRIQMPQDWYNLNIKHFLLNTPDYTASIPLADLLLVLKKMRSVIAKGGDVYIHCKSGMGRSPTVAAIYLWLYGSYDGTLPPHSSFISLYRFLKNKRQQVNLGEAHKQKIEEAQSYLSKYENEVFQLDDSGETIETKISAYLASNEGKNNISQLSMMKMLMINGLVCCKKETKDFIKQIDVAVNANWYFAFLNNKLHLQQTLLERLTCPSNRKIKQMLDYLELLKDQLTAHLADKLNCNRNTLWHLPQRSKR